VTQDFAEAGRWFRKAADGASPKPSSPLAICTPLVWGCRRTTCKRTNGSTSPPPIPASEAKDRDQAVKLRDRVAASMTPAQLAEAQKLAASGSRVSRRKRRNHDDQPTSGGQPPERNHKVRINNGTVVTANTASRRARHSAPGGPPSVRSVSRREPARSCRMEGTPGTYGCAAKRHTHTFPGSAQIDETTLIGRYHRIAVSPKPHLEPYTGRAPRGAHPGGAR